MLAEFKSLEARGAYLTIWGTCLNHFSLFDRVQAGGAGDMADNILAQR